jgi:hypothetical protein
MNEQIRELAEQATIIEEHGWGASYENFDRLKFAQLIVQECAELFDKNEQSELGYRIGDRIYKHFGVE